MATEPDDFPRVLRLYLELNRYPILAPHIRERMRQELFAKRYDAEAKKYLDEIRKQAMIEYKDAKDAKAK